MLMDNIIIQRAQEEDWPYIQEKLVKYALDGTNASWQDFFVARFSDRTVGFTRILDYGDFFELASMGVDYYHRKKGIGKKMLSFLIDEVKRIDPKKPVYGVTHRPGFLSPFGFKEVDEAPEEMVHKKHHKCVLEPSKIKIMKLM